VSMGAIKLDVSVVGERKLARVFNRITATVQKKIMRKALRAGFRPVLASAREKAAAVDDPSTPSDVMLRVSRLLKLRALKRSRRRIGVAIRTPSRDELGSFDYDHYPPAHIEMGTSRTPPHPFMRDALHQNEPKTLGILKRELWRGIKAEANKTR
jgi:HK97 gp10 family phage protein